CRERAVDRMARRVVAAQRVDRDPDQELLLFDRARLPSAIVAAVRTDAMWPLGLVAMRAFAQPRGLERVVCPALGRARLGVSSFWVWHGKPSNPRRRAYDWFLKARSAAIRGSSHSRLQSHDPRFRLVPHTGHNPRHPSPHSGFIGSAR